MMIIIHWARRIPLLQESAKKIKKTQEAAEGAALQRHVMPGKSSWLAVLLTRRDKCPRRGWTHSDSEVCVWKLSWRNHTCHIVIFNYNYSYISSKGIWFPNHLLELLEFSSTAPGYFRKSLRGGTDRTILVAKVTWIGKMKKDEEGWRRMKKDEEGNEQKRTSRETRSND